MASKWFGLVLTSHWSDLWAVASKLHLGLIWFLPHVGVTRGIQMAGNVHVQGVAGVLQVQTAGITAA